MELTRLSLVEPRELAVQFSRGLCVVDDQTPEDLQAIKAALHSIMGGALPDGAQIWTSIDRIEFELTAELVSHLGEAVGPIAVADAATLDQEPTTTALAIRCALESLGAVPARIDAATIDRALERTSTRHEAAISAARAQAARAEVVAAKARTARNETSRYYSTRLEREARRFMRRKARHDILAAEASRAVATAESLVAKRTAEHADLIAELSRVIDRTSAAEEIRELVATEYCLNLRYHLLSGTSALMAADRPALSTAIDVLRPLDDRRTSNDPISDAALWLMHTEHRSAEQALLALIGQRAQPHKTLGLIPIVIDGLDDSRAPWLSRLPEVADELNEDLQLIHLGPLDARTKALA